MVLKKYDQDQSIFICFNPKSNILEGQVSFLVDKIVKELDFSEINGKYEGTPGAHAYNRKIALKIDVMGAIDSIFSSRKICEQLMYNDVYKFLAGNEQIDHRTLCRSRKENENLYKKTLLSTIIIGFKRKMITLEHVGLDGILFKANASIKNLFTVENLKVVDKIIAKRLSCDEEDKLYYQKDTYEIVEKDYFDAIDEILKDNLIETTINEVKTEKEKENHGQKVEKTIEMKDLKKEKTNHKKKSKRLLKKS
jgi:transposase